MRLVARLFARPAKRRRQRIPSVPPSSALRGQAGQASPCLSASAAGRRPSSGSARPRATCLSQRRLICSLGRPSSSWAWTRHGWTSCHTRATAATGQRRRTCHRMCHRTCRRTSSRRQASRRTYRRRRPCLASLSRLQRPQARQPLARQAQARQARQARHKRRFRMKIVEVEKTHYVLAFDDARDSGSGYAFPCDKTGRILWEEVASPKATRKSLAYCKANPDRWTSQSRNGMVKATISRERYGICPHCGSVVYFVESGYMYECTYGYECTCGQWYNVFGQELNPPDAWEYLDEPMEEDEF